MFNALKALHQRFIARYPGATGLMAGDVVDDSPDPQDPGRFTFIETIARKRAPDIDGAVIRQAQEAYAQLTEDSQTFICPKDSIPGWKALCFRKKMGDFDYPAQGDRLVPYQIMGVRDDGAVIGAKYTPDEMGDTLSVLNKDPIHVGRVFTHMIDGRENDDSEISRDGARLAAGG